MTDEVANQVKISSRIAPHPALTRHLPPDGGRLSTQKKAERISVQPFCFYPPRHREARRARCPHRAESVIPSRCAHRRGNPFSWRGSRGSADCRVAPLLAMTGGPPFVPRPLPYADSIVICLLYFCPCHGIMYLRRNRIFYSTDVENVFLPFGKNALSLLAFSMSVKVIASQQAELCVFRCVVPSGAAHFFIFF